MRHSVRTISNQFSNSIQPLINRDEDEDLVIQDVDDEVDHEFHKIGNKEDIKSANLILNTRDGQILTLSQNDGKNDSAEFDTMQARAYLKKNLKQRKSKTS